jgi:hypothetical protein
MTNGQLLHALGNNWDEYFPFLISFVVIANHWAVHRKIFRPGAPETARHPDHAASLAVIIAFLVSIPVSFYTESAFALWGTIPLLARVLRRLPGSGRWSTRSAGRRPAARNGS